MSHLILVLGIFVGVAEAWGPTLEELVVDAEVIAEGHVVGQENAPFSRLSEFKLKRVSDFKIMKVYKGDVKPGETIKVYSHSTETANVSALVHNTKYILFLKRRGEAFIDVDKGSGQWTIFIKDGKKWIKSWMPGDEGEHYREFVGKVKRIHWGTSMAGY